MVPSGIYGLHRWKFVRYKQIQQIRFEKSTNRKKTQLKKMFITEKPNNSKNILINDETCKYFCVSMNVCEVARGGLYKISACISVWLSLCVSECVHRNLCVHQSQLLVFSFHLLFTLCIRLPLRETKSRTPNDNDNDDYERYTKRWTLDCVAI